MNKLLISLEPILMKKLFVVRHTIDALLGELERSKEDSINNARARHGDAET